MRSAAKALFGGARPVVRAHRRAPPKRNKETPVRTPTKGQWSKGREGVGGFLWWCALS